MNAIISKYRVIIISSILSLFIIGFIGFVVHLEIEQAKQRAFERAKEIITSEKVDKASKVTGRVFFEVKNFKNKVSDEVKRLEDSTKN
jgi:hypothetical protein